MPRNPISTRRFACLLIGAFMALAVPAARAQPLVLGFTDPVFQDSGVQQEWLLRASTVGATSARLMAFWRAIEFADPAEPTNPADPAYRWNGLDASVRDATEANIAPTISVFGAPVWAEGPGRPSGTATGVWKPIPRRLGDFAQAIATRYSGSYPDPSMPGAALPRVETFQAWNEPNLSSNLSPQWRQTDDGAWRTTSPDLYRSLLDAFYAGINRGNAQAEVMTAGTAPFGDLVAGGNRLPPARFWRELLCLNERLRARACPGPAYFDVYDHHPYSVGGPTRHARNPDDVSIPDLDKISRSVAAAVRQGTALPKVSKPMWITEVSWDSAPPDPDGVPEATRARWLQQMLEILWRQGAETVTWYLVRDEAPEPSYAATYQSGVFERNGTEKLAAQAFVFPFVVSRSTGGRSRIWGRSPGPGRLVLEMRTGSRWRRIAAFDVKEHQVFQRSLRIRFGATVRARVGGTVSLSSTIR